MADLFVDPGSEYSAYVLTEQMPNENPKILEFGKIPNQDMFAVLERLRSTIGVFAIEVPQPRGQRPHSQLFHTCIYIGRVLERWGEKWVEVDRNDVKIHLCGTSRSKDKHVRAALIARWGGQEAIGKKASPGPLYGISADVWQALGIAVAYYGGGIREREEFGRKTRKPGTKKATKKKRWRKKTRY
jgi:hypothetical protein